MSAQVLGVMFLGCPIDLAVPYTGTNRLLELKETQHLKLCILKKESRGPESFTKVMTNSHSP